MKFDDLSKEAQRYAIDTFRAKYSLIGDDDEMLNDDFVAWELRDIDAEFNNKGWMFPEY